MADYIYLLENRLSGAQQSALAAVREIARAQGLTVFLVGGAVRDLTSGSPVRDLDVAVQGNALSLKKEIENAGAQIAGEYAPLESVFARFPGNVRMEISSTVEVSYATPGSPSVRAATIQEDLRCRDFTANAMALSLNEGSYGLLMDPLNGVADIENRELRLVSNYGFIEDPVRMVRAARLSARLGWQLEEKTQARYEAGKAEGYISALSEFQRGYELEEIVHEEDPLRVLTRLEAEGWMKVLCPAWTTAKANVAELEKLREAQAQLQMQGVVADASAAQFPLLTAKLTAKDVAGLKKLFPRRGFVAEIEALDAEGRRFAAELSSKQAASPSAAWRLIMSAPPEVVLWVAYSTRSTALQNKFKSFYEEWPAARQRIPYALMQEMRISPELSGYNELVEKLFFELMDARLGTTEEMKVFLEPHSPPAPAPPVNTRRARAAKGARAGKGRKRTEESAEEPGSLAPELAAEAASAIVGTELVAAVGAGGEEIASGGTASPAGAAGHENGRVAAVAKSGASTDAGRAASKGPGKSAAISKNAGSGVTTKVAHGADHRTAPAKKAIPAKVGKTAAEKRSAAGAAKKPSASKTSAGKSALVAARGSGSARRAPKPASKPTRSAGSKNASKPGSKVGAKVVNKSTSAQQRKQSGRAAPPKTSAKPAKAANRSSAKKAKRR